MCGKNQDPAAIEKLTKDWNSGWIRNDIMARLYLYADKFVLLPQGRPAVSGSDAIRSLQYSVLKEFTVKGEDKVILQCQPDGSWKIARLVDNSGLEPETT